MKILHARGEVEQENLKNVKKVFLLTGGLRRRVLKIKITSTDLVQKKEVPLKWNLALTFWNCSTRLDKLLSKPQLKSPTRFFCLWFSHFLISYRFIIHFSTTTTLHSTLFEWHILFDQYLVMVIKGWFTRKCGWKCGFRCGEVKNNFYLTYD